MQKEIKQSWHFSQSPEEVWDYLTKPELLELWLAKSDFKPIVGHKFRFDGREGCIEYCEVLEVKPYTRLSYSWQYSSVKDHQRYDSKVLWTLVPSENGTELQLVHNGFTSLEDLVGHDEGWTELGRRLTEILNTVLK